MNNIIVKFNDLIYEISEIINIGNILDNYLTEENFLDLDLLNDDKINYLVFDRLSNLLPMLLEDSPDKNIINWPQINEHLSLMKFYLKQNNQIKASEILHSLLNDVLKAYNNLKKETRGLNK